MENIKTKSFDFGYKHKAGTVFLSELAEIGSLK